MSSISSGTPVGLVNNVYATLAERVSLGRQRLGRPLTLAEKILINHLVEPTTQDMGAAQVTPISTPIASPCKTQLRKWLYCNS